MASKVCMNVLCGAASSTDWRKGWSLRSGELANLCDKCGLAFEQMNFCDTFHSKDSGWRECTSCGKHLHCGCIVSRSLLELLDTGGVNCISCAKSLGLHPMVSSEKPNESGKLAVDRLQCSLLVNKIDGDTVVKLPTQLGDVLDGSGLHLLQCCSNDAIDTCGQMKQEEVIHSLGELGSTKFTNLSQTSVGYSQTTNPDVCKKFVGANDMYDTSVQTNLSITLGIPSGNLHHGPVAAIEEREQIKGSSGVHQGPRSRHLLPKPPKAVLAMGLEPNMSKTPQIRVARPPAEGRGRNQLLPRYWPRITDQELQQISGDSNSTIVPLFEKVLSASDAGRIGRLVLPKACAEAYFPPISQPEGVPLRIQDVKGKEWVFQFRFWPNNNSRMYVLEGVTPCIQSMQLQAGDTVTFSRMDPEGKLVMGFRKAVNSLTMQDNQLPAIPNGTHSSETFFSGVMENLPIVSGYSGLLQSLKGCSDPHVNMLSKQLTSSGNVRSLKTEKHGDRTGDGSVMLPMLVPERKRSRNIGLKSKRLLIDSQDALELKFTWEEAQGLLRPPPCTKPSIILVEDHEIEEYEEPPVFGKRSIFTVRASGEQEQWAQCDNCSKWRKLPVDVLLPLKWTCADNILDGSRRSCSAPDELSTRELENLLRLNKDFKRRKISTAHRPIQEPESSGLDALANAAVIGDNVSDSDAAAVAATTRHPRHRPGCSCIVCIQPPSGKGKHKPTCTCNVCMTVQRRFKTLMMRKKKRQLERENEIAQRNQHLSRPKDDEAEVDSSSRHVPSSQMECSENEARLANEPESGDKSNNLSSKADESGKGNIDLNCQPDREDDLQARSTHTSMMSLLQVASLPLNTYLKQNGLSSLLSEQQSNSGSNMMPQPAVETDKQPDEECHLDPKAPERDQKGDDRCPQSDQSQKEPV